MNDRSRPKAAPEAVSVAATSTSKFSAQHCQHPASVAEDALPWWNRLAWTQAIERAAKNRRTFTADELQRTVPGAQSGHPTTLRDVVVRAVRRR